MGLMLAEPGFHTRCFVEWEEYPRASIIAAQQSGYFAPAPIWDDLTTFDAKPFAGAIDTLLAGYPCQPFSQAGKRLGADDPRHLWPHVARVIRELGDGLRWVFLENVAGHITLGAETVLRELWEMGWTPAAGAFSAAETGAPHERLRWFCVAHRNSQNRGADGGEPNAGANWRNVASRRGGNVADPGRAERRPGAGTGCFPHGDDAGREEAAGRTCQPSGARDGNLVDPGQPGLEGRELGRPSGERDRQAPSGPTAELRRPLLHAPGPADMDQWRFTLDLAPDLAPALSLGHVVGVADRAAQMVAQGLMAEEAAESLVRRMADGLALRSRALRLLGNGVHPLAAANAWRALASAHGLGPVDLGAE